jgi:hypothetical protein
MSNYRSISLLTTFYEVRVPDNVMHNRLSHYLQNNNILVPEQFGFRKWMFIEDAAFKLTESVSKSLNKNARWWNILWFGKNFDCVNQDILLTKLHFIGTQGTTLSWFWSFLSDKKQETKIKSPNSIQSTYSNWGSRKHEIPQGSISRPLLH